jgi:hypothetical protein
MMPFQSLRQVALLPVLAVLVLACAAPAAQATAGACVEPLSAPVRLSMTADEVLRALGKPRSDNRYYGGGLSYPGLMVLFDTAGREIWSLTLTGDTRLACGLKVGSTLAEARAGFPGGTMVYDVYQVRAGQYELGFRNAAGSVSEIRIRPAGRRFTSIEPGAAAAAPAPAIELPALAGRWIEPRSGQSFQIFPEGRYRTALGAEGAVVSGAEGLVFSGPLQAWNKGRATVTADRKVIEFLWTAADGARQYFAFLRAD